MAETDFGHLLNSYMQRVGISDAELGRAVGVSRQTIFRWREGQTSRPRQRADVLAIAKKLRLTPEERDTLLLAAGFQPEQVDIEQFRAASASAPATEPPRRLAVDNGGVTPFPSSDRALPEWSRTVPTPILSILTALILVAIVSFGGLIWWTSPDSDQNQTIPLLKRANLPATSSGLTPNSSEETVILVTHFANYATSQLGYNVAGRLAEALQREIDDLRLQKTRVTILDEVVAERDQALQIGQSAGATLVIYGEYDVGRVVVKFATPSDKDSFINPALLRHVFDIKELSATINSDLPQQVQSLALMALGQIYLFQNDPEQAQILLAQARDTLQQEPGLDQKTWALVNFYLGTAQQLSSAPALDRAIKAYTEAIEAWPQMISSRSNRIAAYKARNQPGDLDLALADADTVVQAAPEWGLAYNNRASIRMSLGGASNLALALADLEQAIAIDPDLPEAYFNRAYVYLGQNRPMREAVPDLEKTLELRPDYGTALNLLCWGYAIEGKPDMAIAYCQQAIETDPDNPEFKDSRGLAYALQGNFEPAIVDFEAYAAWLENEPPGSARERELSRRHLWIDSLKTGQNPFTAALLAELRQELLQ